MTTALDADHIEAEFTEPAAAAFPAPAEEATSHFDGQLTAHFGQIEVDWSGPEAATLDRIHQAVDDRVLALFTDAYAVLADLWDIVRVGKIDPRTGEVRTEAGRILWERTDGGSIVEDWTKLTHGEMSNFLFRIATGLAFWEPRAAQCGSDADFMKSEWIAQNGGRFVAAGGPVDARRAQAAVDSAEARFRAVLYVAVARKAEALVRSMVRIEQRLKDVTTSR